MAKPSRTRKPKETSSKRRSGEPGHHTYRVTITGTLAEAASELHGGLQKSRKFRRLASGDIHELVRECIDRGMQMIEQELEEELDKD